MEKEKIKIAALQMESIIGDVQANRAKVEKLLEEGLKNKKADIIVLPEVWTVGWDCEKFIASAEDISCSQTINLLKNLAQKYSAYILGGSFVEQRENEFGYLFFEDEFESRLRYFLKFDCILEFYDHVHHLFECFLLKRFSRKRN